MFTNAGFYALIALVIVHLFANKATVLGWIWHGRFLSFAAGISLAYVFVSLLPSLQEKQPILEQTFSTTLPYLSKHAYVMSLLGLLFYYGIHRKAGNKEYWLPLMGYIFFNFLVGASLSDSSDPDIQPIILFTTAIAMHYFVRDHKAKECNQKLYEQKTRWCLVIALFAGYISGFYARIPDVVVALCISFISGGMILNALHYELPKRQDGGYLFFVVGALLYTALLLELGAT